ncbi:MAG: hypothetical protein E6I80_11205 [Chloroflexi bacterium]|nr:MAG: hypothetical protein E6I80_11205 [Chloroflexota bacterium]
MIAEPPSLDQYTLTCLREADPVVQHYRAFFALLNWNEIDQQDATRHQRGPRPHPKSAYLKAFLVGLCEGKPYRTQLRTFLLQHPWLVLELGFRPHTSTEEAAHAPYGFDVGRTVPSDRWLRAQLQHLDETLLQSLFMQSVHALQQEIPGLGETVAFDVKHIFAWVRENNPNVYVKGRFDVTHIPTGDPDCRLGVKKSTNQEQPDGSKKEKKVSLFGYGTGVAACTDPVYGDVVVADFTQPFNEGDVTYFRPLYRHTVLAFERYPTHITADAAFDAWYVYQGAALHGGIGAIPLNQHAHPTFSRDADGTPRCPKGLLMHPTFPFQHTNGYRAQRFRCPLLFPHITGETCDHAQFTKGCGCVKDANWELGGQMRVTLNRDGPLYHGIYNQRTAAERINSQAQALGIERPKVRNGRSVAHLNTLIYLIINVRALAKAKSINAGLLQIK